MEIKPLTKNLIKVLLKHGLVNKYQKQKKLFEKNPRHPSLHTEILIPKHLRIYSFRIDKKWRAVFIIVNDMAEIVDINSHYK